MSSTAPQPLQLPSSLRTCGSALRGPSPSWPLFPPLRAAGLILAPSGAVASCDGCFWSGWWSVWVELPPGLLRFLTAALATGGASDRGVLKAEVWWEGSI